MTEVGDQRSGVRRQRTEDQKVRRSEGRGRMTEDRRSEDRDQMTEDRRSEGQKVEDKRSEGQKVEVR